MGYTRERESIHTRWNVLAHMFFTICLRYRSLPDPRTLDADEVEVFYDAIRAQLIEDTRPRNDKGL